LNAQNQAQVDALTFYQNEITTLQSKIAAELKSAQKTEGSST